MEIHTLHDLFVHELRGVYHVERRLVDVLDDVAANAENHRVEAAFAQHRDETVEHVAHVEGTFRALGREPAARDYPVVDVLLEAADRLELGHGVTDPLRDVHDSEKEAFDQLRLLATASELKRLWHRLRP